MQTIREKQGVLVVKVDRSLRLDSYDPSSQDETASKDDTRCDRPVSVDSDCPSSTAKEGHNEEGASVVDTKETEEGTGNCDGQKDIADAHQNAEVDGDIPVQADGIEEPQETGNGDGEVQIGKAVTSTEGKARSKKRNKAQDEDLPVGLPVTRVKRIMRLDPDIRLVSKEAMFAVIHTTQLFLECLAEESIVQARKRKRKGVVANDVVLAAKSHSRFRNCFGNSLTDFLHSLSQGRGNDETLTRSNDDDSAGSEDQQHDEKSNFSKRQKQLKKKKIPLPPANNHSMTEFFSHRRVVEKGETSAIGEPESV